MSDLVIAKRRIAEFRIHPLGFFYLQDRKQNGVNHRVHIWLGGGAARPENDRHQHSFDIDSSVVVGRMQSQLFQFRESRDRNIKEYSVQYKAGRSILSPTNRSGFLELLSEFEAVAGTSYYLMAGIIHRVTITERPCVTVLTTKERGVPIFSYGTQQQEQPFERRVVNKEEANKIEALLEKL